MCGRRPILAAPPSQRLRPTWARTFQSSSKRGAATEGWPLRQAVVPFGRLCGERLWLKGTNWAAGNPRHGVREARFAKRFCPPRPLHPGVSAPCWNCR